MPSGSTLEHQRHRIVVESTFASLDRVIEEADTFARASGADDDLAYKVVLLTTEAVTNAIEHGNEMDPSKSVSIDFTALDGKIEVRVLDEGHGFNPDALQSPLTTENLLNDGGRGIFLIKTMADAFSIEKGGREIRMAFDVLPGQSQSEAS